MEKHFAALKLLDSDNDCKLTRAFSYSELPSSHRVCLKESYHFGSPTNLVRQCSYEQIFDKTANTRQFKISNVVTTNQECKNNWQTVGSFSNYFTSSNRQFYKSNNIIQTPKFVPQQKSNETVCKESKNVDVLKDFKSSFHCPSVSTNLPDDKKEHLLCSKSKDLEKTNITSKPCNITNNKDRNTYEDIKKKYRPLVAKNINPVKRKVNRCCCSFLCLCVFPIVVAILTLFLNFDTLAVCDHSTLFSNASLELQQKIYGQRGAVSNIATFLNTESFYVKVLCLVGGTGVGKSYTADIIAKNFPYKDAIFIHDSILDNAIDINRLNSSHSDVLLIMENLKIKDLDFFSNTINMLSKNKNKCITVLAVFSVKGVNNYVGREANSIQSTDAISKIFADTNVNFLIVPYEPLNEETLKMCVMETARNSNMTLTANQINTIIQTLLFSGSGCKGAYSKVHVIGRE